jgi:glutaminyl-tRNA synthetase
MLEAPYWPHDVPKEGSRPLPFTRELWIEREDFAEEPAKGWHRLAPGAEVRLRYGYVVRCNEVVKDAQGEVVELRCTYDPTTRGGAAPVGRKVPGTLHWVSAAHAVDVEVRLYDRLFRGEQPDEGDYGESLNPDSLRVLDGCKAEPGLAAAEPGARFQFERLGYFYLEPESHRVGESGAVKRVFNRIVTLKDTWAKLVKRDGAAAPAPRRARDAQAGATAAPASTDPLAGLQPLQREETVRLRDAHGISVEAARVLAGDAALLTLLAEGLAAGAPSRALANWLANDVVREREAAGVAVLPFDGAALAELVRLVEAGTLSTGGGREVLAELVRQGGSPPEIVGRLRLAQVSDEGALAAAVDGVMARAEANVRAYREGRSGLLGWFVGQVMKESGGRANPQLVQRLVRERLDGPAAG